MNRLYEYMNRQLAATPCSFHRYCYESINWGNHMFGLVGPRGIGKTTLFLQKIKESSWGNEALYVSAENMYFADHSLLEVADSFYKSGGHFLFIDEGGGGTENPYLTDDVRRIGCTHTRTG